MRSIAVINQKGGVGKTTSAVNLAAALANKGQRVCLIDLDPQAHASLHLGIAPENAKTTVYDVLTGPMGIAQAVQTVAPNIDVLPSHLDLAAAEIELADEVGRELILRDKVNELDGAYDFIFIDCPPSLGVLTLNALVAVKEVFLPLQPHFLALHGLSKLLETIEVVVRRLNRDLKLTGVLFCMYDSATRLATEITEDVDGFFSAVDDERCPWNGATRFKTCVRRNIRLAEAPSFGQSILKYAPHSNGAEDYRNLADEVLAMQSIRRDYKPQLPTEAHRFTATAFHG